MPLPNVGDVVFYKLASGPKQGQHRKALVYARWIDEGRQVQAFAGKFSITEGQAIERHGDRLSLSIELEDDDLPGLAEKRHQVTNVEHDADGQREGTWCSADELPPADDVGGREVHAPGEAAP